MEDWDIRVYREVVKFLLPYAEKAFDLEANKYSGPMFNFYEINCAVKRWEKSNNDKEES